MISQKKFLIGLKYYGLIMLIPFIFLVVSNIYLDNYNKPDSLQPETNIHPSPNLLYDFVSQVNYLSDKSFALLCMPIYIPYKGVEHVVKNYDKILEFLGNCLEKTLKYFVNEILVPFIRFIFVD